MGSFPYGYFNGGKLNTADQKFMKYEDIVNFSLNNIALPLYLDCSNINLLEKDFNDTIFNETLKIIENYSNGIIVSSSELKNYIKCNYPSFKIIASEFFDFKDLENIDIFLCRPNKVNTNIDINKINIIISKGCDCKNYEDCCLAQQLNQYNFSSIDIFDNCNKINKKITCFSLPEIKQIFQKKGINNFSFDLNSLPINNEYDFICFFIAYFIKLEY